MRRFPSRPAAAVVMPPSWRGVGAADSQRHRPRVAERHGHGRRELRHRSRGSGLRGLRGRRQAGPHVLLALQQPIALAVLLDTSNSMEDQLPTAQEAAVGFAKRLRPRRDGSHRLRQPGRRRPAVHERVAALEKAIRDTTVNGSTSLYNAIYISLKELKRVRRAVGGRDPPPGDRRALGRRRHVEPDAVRRGARSGEAIRDGDLRHRPPPDGHRAAALQGSGVRPPAAVAGDRRAFVLPHQRVSELPKIYEQISEELASQYSLAYTSKNRMRNGAWRRIVVRVTRPGLTARTRQGYFGPTGQ